MAQENTISNDETLFLLDRIYGIIEKASAKELYDIRQVIERMGY